MILDYDELGRVLAATRGPAGPPPGYRRTAVALPLFDRDGQTLLLAIQKTDTEGYHWRNQVALPGGHVAPEDRCETDTALRELEEEVCIPPADVAILGPLGHFQTATSNADLAVTVTRWNGRSEPVGDCREVARVLRIPLTTLLERHVAHGYRSAAAQSVGDRLIYPVPPASIWGVTARILHHFLELILNHAWVLRRQPA
jgi:8-oxo-dGTP pyrophosphatase MutT (NUDIX family)